MTTLIVGDPLPEWTPPQWPGHEAMVGRYCRVEPLVPGMHAEALFAANRLDVEGHNWTYLPYGPMEDLDVYREWLDEVTSTADPQFYAIVDPSIGPVGVAAYLRIKPSSGSIEVGHLNFSPLLQRGRSGTEAMFLMMRRVFDELGYRRYEWKCDALNAPSRRAAERLGFRHEGIFRQATVYKGRNRDTAWYAIIDAEWPEIRAAFEEWLNPENFDAEGVQRTRLRHLSPSVKVGGRVEGGQ